MKALSLLIKQGVKQVFISNRKLYAKTKLYFNGTMKIYSISSYPGPIRLKIEQNNDLYFELRGIALWEN